MGAGAHFVPKLIVYLRCQFCHQQDCKRCKHFFRSQLKSKGSNIFIWSFCLQDPHAPQFRFSSWSTTLAMTTSSEQPFRTSYCIYTFVDMIWFDAPSASGRIVGIYWWIGLLSLCFALISNIFLCRIQLQPTMCYFPLDITSCVSWSL